MLKIRAICGCRAAMARISADELGIVEVAPRPLAGMRPPAGSSPPRVRRRAAQRQGGHGRGGEIAAVRRARSCGEDALLQPDVAVHATLSEMATHERIWEVFRQEDEGDPMIHAGNVNAPDEELAMHYAREFYGRRGESHRLWIVARDAITELDDPDLLKPPFDRSHKKPGGYIIKHKLEAGEAACRLGAGGVTSAPPSLDAPTRAALAELLLSVADDEFVIGFWDSEWTGIAPMLEEDVATSSVAQDEIGHARALYELLAELTGDDADAIAFGRDADAFRHAALLNHARGDWAFSVGRRYLYETADAVRLAALARSGLRAARAAGGQDAARGDLPPASRRCLAAPPRRWGTRGPRSPGGRDPNPLGRCAGRSSLRSPPSLRCSPPGCCPSRCPTCTRSGCATSDLASSPSRARCPRSRPTPPAGRCERTSFDWLHGELTLVAASEEGAVW